MENPRILLTSKKFLKKETNIDSNLVGSCFMSHPGITEVAEIHKSTAEKCLKNETDDTFKVF